MSIEVYSSTVYYFLDGILEMNYIVVNNGDVCRMLSFQA